MKGQDGRTDETDFFGLERIFVFQTCAGRPVFRSYTLRIVSFVKPS